MAGNAEEEGLVENRSLQSWNVGGKLLNLHSISALQSCRPILISAVHASPFVRSFPLTPVWLGQKFTVAFAAEGGEWLRASQGSLPKTRFSARFIKPARMMV